MVALPYPYISLDAVAHIYVQLFFYFGYLVLSNLEFQNIRRQQTLRAMLGCEEDNTVAELVGIRRSDVFKILHLPRGLLLNIMGGQTGKRAKKRVGYSTKKKTGKHQ